MREYARAKGAEVTYLPTVPPELRIDTGALSAELARRQTRAANLFAYPAQSNFTGVQHSLDWIKRAQDKGWDVVLDAAAFVPTRALDLSKWKPDFVSISFYKMFGYPTGVGCLLARKEALVKLRRPWFAGGTISIASVQGEGWHYLIQNKAGFEDGTVNFLNLPAIEIGLRVITEIGIDRIQERVSCLTSWLLDRMTAIRHKNGTPLVQIYGPTNMHHRGGTIAFSLDDPDGNRFDFRKIEALAYREKISLRTGSFCNPGTGEIVHNLTKHELAYVYGQPRGMSFNDFFDWARNEHNLNPSAIRISVGIASNFEDVYRFMVFLQKFVDKPNTAFQHVANVIPPDDFIRDSA
jgi:selenocysteine lyase/cysteine desulfurase